MAQRSKTKKNQYSGPSSLKTEKDTRLTVSQVIRDERTHKITGAVFLLVSVFLFIAFSSYLFTWREDQDKVFRGISILAPSHDVKVANLLGNLGAYISHLFFYKGFGIASYFICSFFFYYRHQLVICQKVFFDQTKSALCVDRTGLFIGHPGFCMPKYFLSMGRCFRRYDQRLGDAFPGQDWNGLRIICRGYGIFYLAFQS